MWMVLPTTLAFLLEAAPSLALDAGVVEPKRPAEDAGVSAAPEKTTDAKAMEAKEAKEAKAAEAKAQRGELDRLRRDLDDVRARTAVLERQAAQPEALTQQLERIERQLGDLKRQLTAAEERRQDAERQVAERRTRLEAATTSLGDAQQTLATGSTDVGAAIAAAEAVYSGAALRYLQAARQALSNGDLGTARQYLALAALEASQSRP